jgi:outer membrane protein assembly factor BamD
MSNNLRPSPKFFPAPVFVRRRRSPRRLLVALRPVLLAFGLAACGETGLQVQVPARTLYFEALNLEDQELFSESITRVQSVATENPGTRLGTFAYLKLGELYSRQENWIEADTNYRLFLSLNSNSHLTPYVLYRLMVVNYNAGLTGLFFPTREVDRDMEPNRRLLVEFKRFFLLYPNSPYLEDVRPYYRAARELLARYELMVGDFYTRRESYYSAIGRYFYLLRNFPEYPETRDVMGKLIRAYRANQQEDLAAEIERIYRLRYVSPPPEQGQVEDFGDQELPPQPALPPGR